MSTVISDMTKVVQREEKKTSVVIINEHMKKLFGEKIALLRIEDVMDSTEALSTTQENESEGKIRSAVRKSMRYCQDSMDKTESTVSANYAIASPENFRIIRFDQQGGFYYRPSDPFSQGKLVGYDSKCNQFIVRYEDMNGQAYLFNDNMQNFFPWKPLLNKLYQSHEEAGVLHSRILCIPRVRLTRNGSWFLRHMGFILPHRVYFILDHADISDQWSILSWQIISYINTGGKGMKLYASDDDFQTTVNECVIQFFVRQRQALDTDGYVIIQGVFDDEALLKQDLTGCASAPVWNTFSKDSFSKLWRFYNKSFAQQQRNTSDCQVHLFEPIVNVIDGEGKLQYHTNHPATCRFMTSCYATNDYLECKDKKKKDLLKIRCALEVRAATIVSLLGLNFPSYIEAQNAWKNPEFIPADALRIPVSGGRFLAHGKDAARQSPHFDEQPAIPLCAENTSKYPGYFVIVTGVSKATLWVAKGSHKYVFGSSFEKFCASQHLKLRRITIPPFSAIIVRSDCWHAGASGADTNGKACVRYHIYFVRRSTLHIDAIHTSMGFNLPFEETSASIKSSSSSK